MVSFRDNMIDESKMKQVELDLFQNRVEQAVPAAVEIISALDMDDDDEASVASGLRFRTPSR